MISDQNDFSSRRVLRLFLIITGVGISLALLDIFRLTLEREYLASSIRYQLGLIGLLITGVAVFSLADC